MKITLQKLKELDATKEDIKWFKTKYDTEQVELSTLVKDLKADDELDLVCWLLPKLMKDKVTKVKFSVYCAELVLPIFEQKHPDDKKPRLAIEAAQAWIAKPCEKTRKAAHCAAKAAAEAAAWAAAWAAAYAVAARCAAAYAASWTARAARAAAEAARNAAACAADYEPTWAARAANAAADAAKEVNAEFHAEVVDKIIKCGLELLEE